MACTTGGYVQTGYSKPSITICTTVSGSNVTVSLEGISTESNPFTGYVQLIIEKEHPTTEGWVAVSSPKIGNWATSNKVKTHTFANGSNSGKTMRVKAEFYRYSDYTGKLTSSVSHIFYQS